MRRPPPLLTLTLTACLLTGPRPARSAACTGSGTDWFHTCSYRAGYAECAYQVVDFPPRTALVYFGGHPDRPPAGRQGSIAVYCVGAAFLSTQVAGLLQRLTFNDSVVAGSMVVEEDCWQSGDRSQCVDEVLMAEGLMEWVLATCLDADFWDFSRMPAGWLLGMDVRAEAPGARMPLDRLFQLQNTSLRHLRLERLSDGAADMALGHMPLLRTFVLSGVRLADFPGDISRYMPNIETLDLSYNCLSSFPKGTENLRSLKQLNVGMNGPCTGVEFDVDGRVLGQLASLEALDVSGNHLRQLGSALPLLPSLLTLNVSANLLTLLPAVARAAPNLSSVDASHNRIATAVSDAFFSLARLSALNLSHNRVTHLQLHLLHPVSLVDLTSNNVTSLAGCSRSESALLGTLDLSRNNISSWNSTTVFGRPTSRCVRTANLSHNGLVTVTQAMGRSLDALLELDLRGNPLDCADCRTPALQAWLARTRTTLVGGPPRCAAPPPLAGAPLPGLRFDARACQPARPPYLLYVGAPAAVALCLLAALALAAYAYRFEVRYMAHLAKTKKLFEKGQRCEPATPVYDAFVCYSGYDRSWVIGTLMTALEDGPQKYRLCLHDRDFALGSRIIRNIVFSIEHSRRTILVLSENFLKSKWCQWEVDLVNHKLFEASDRDFLILLELERVQRSSVPRHLRLLMDTRTYLQWPQGVEGTEQALRRLERALGPSIYCQTSDRAPLLSDC